MCLLWVVSGNEKAPGGLMSARALLNSILGYSELGVFTREIMRWRSLARMRVLRLERRWRIVAGAHADFGLVVDGDADLAEGSWLGTRRKRVASA